MTSEELNKKIKTICDDERAYKSFGGKSIPYIGWFWRDVDFNTQVYSFGVIPAEVDYNPKNCVGFMENNKWDYPYVNADKNDWKKIKELLADAIEDTTYENLKALDDKIQSLADGKKWKYVKNHCGSKYYVEVE